MGFIDIFNYKKYFKVKADATVARVGHVNAVYTALQSGLVGPRGPKGDTGLTGPAGPAVPAGLDWKGGYNSGAAYELNDVVSFINPATDVIGSYWVTVATITGTPPTDDEGVINAGWAFLASQGPAGVDGITSINGITGHVSVDLANNSYTTNTWGTRIEQSGSTISVGLNQAYKSIVGNLYHQGGIFVFTPIVNEWGGTITTNTYFPSPNAQCELVFGNSFAGKPVAVQITPADKNVASRKWYSSENNDDTKLSIYVGMGTTTSSQVVTTGNLTGMKALVEIRFYNG